MIRHDRGIIYDRYGRILVDNRPSLDLQMTPAFLGSKEEFQDTLDRLSIYIDFTPSEREALRQRIKANRGLTRFRPLVVRRDLNRAQVERIEADRATFALDGVEIVEGRRRVYRYGGTASHVLGYVNEIDARALDRERQKGNPLGYRLGDLIGRDGLERTHEDALRGVDGYRKIVVDAKGRRLQDEFIDQLLGPEHEVPAKPGNNVFLSLDIELQQAAERKFKELGVAGSVVALDANTGAVLTMVSMPEFDPNRIAGADAAAYKRELDSDPLKPWINRP
ncbi:MAG: penicillin-binding protein 2, partial [Myxococcota bacterium]